MNQESERTQIGVVGTGYVGLVVAACLAEKGFSIVAHDRDHRKIESLQLGSSPFYEPSLDEKVSCGLQNGNLNFSSSVQALSNCDVIFLAVGTPSIGGKADLSQLWSSLEVLLPICKKNPTLVIKSTVPPGTADTVENWVREKGWKNEIVSNPEFLREGSAVQDFLYPERVVLGSSANAKQLIEIYQSFVPRERILQISRRSAELSKYAANTFLAARISLINEMALLAEQFGADIEQICSVLGTDSRIGPQFLKAGCGYGGSCFPKDIEVLLDCSPIDLHVVKAVEKTNYRMKAHLVEKLKVFFPTGLQGQKILVLGCSFKSETDDLRQAPSLTILDRLVELGCSVSVWDPIALKGLREIFENRVTYAANALDGAQGAVAILLVTEWDQFLSLDWKKIRDVVRKPLILDGRNFLKDLNLEQLGFEYCGIGR